MGLSTQATTTVVKSVQIKPALKRRMRTELKALATVKEQIAALESRLATHRESIEECLIETGEQSLSLDGYKVTLVQPITSRLDKQKLVTLGVTTAQIEMATIVSPGTPYIKVTLPKQNGRSDD